METDRSSRSYLAVSTLGLTFFCLLVFPVLSRRLPMLAEGPAWIILLLLVVPLSGWHWRQRVHRRRFWLRHHLARDSGWYAWLRGGHLMLPWSVIRAVMLSAALLAGLLAGSLSLWLAILTPLVVMLVRQTVERMFAAALNREALWLFSERASRWLSVVVLTALYVLIAFFQPQPDLAGLSFDEVVARTLTGVVANSELVSMILGVEQLQSVLFSWVLQTALEQQASPWLLLAGWLSILARGAIFFLPVVELTLLCHRGARR